MTRKKSFFYPPIDDREYRLVNKWGRMFVEARYKGEEWSGWLFAASKTEKRNWIYVPELDVYRCNVSVL